MDYTIYICKYIGPNKIDKKSDFKTCTCIKDINFGNSRITLKYQSLIYRFFFQFKQVNVINIYLF